MPTYTLKDIPDELYERIKESADLSRRSINSEILHRLERSLVSERIDPARFLQRVRTRRGRRDLPRIDEDEIRAAREAGRP